MNYYVGLNEYDIGTHLVETTGIVEDESYIKVDSGDEDVLFRKYNRSERSWSFEKYEIKEIVWGIVEN